MSGLPALGALVKAVKTKAKNHKSLTALDGGTLHVRSDHSALNTLLQSAGALICKKWGVMLEKELLRRGYRHGWDGDFVFLAWVHDEFQIAARTPELAGKRLRSRGAGTALRPPWGSRPALAWPPRVRPRARNRPSILPSF